jgi:hypothetical protein
MAAEKRGYPLMCFANNWDPVFSTHRDLKDDDESFVEARRGIGAGGDDLSIFLQDSEDSGSPCEVEEVREFCQGASLEDLKAGTGRAGQRQAAWLDDRNSPHLTGSGDARQYENPLTATGLYRLLKEPVWKESKLPPWRKVKADLILAIRQQR